MKLGELRAALRNHKGKVYVEAVVQGKTVQVPVQKTEFIKDTLAHYGEHKNSETGLTLEGDRVVREGGVTAAPRPLAQEPDYLHEDDDLLPNGGADPQPSSDEGADEGEAFEDLLG